MACTSAKSAYIGILTFTFGLFAQLRGPMFVSAEVKLTGSSEKAMTGSPFELVCSFKGLQPVTGFEMSLNNKSAITIVGNCMLLLQPNNSLYEYNCQSKTQLKLTIKAVTRDNDGDIWRCKVFFSGLSESTTYMISMYENTTEITTSTEATFATTENTDHASLRPASSTETFSEIENTGHASLRTTSSTETFSEIESRRSQNDKTATIIGATLGAVCFVLLVYSAVVTVILIRKICRKDTKPLDQTANQRIYANVGDQSNVTAEEGREGPIGRVGLNECMEASVYTSLDPDKRDDTAAYGVLHTYSV